VAEGARKIPTVAVEALAIELSRETGDPSIKDGAGTYERAKLDRARRLLQAAYPHRLAAFSEALVAKLNSDAAIQQVESDLEEAYEAEKSFQEEAELVLETVRNLLATLKISGGDRA
jgi:Rad3-related DNA helicase